MVRTRQQVIEDDDEEEESVQTSVVFHVSKPEVLSTFLTNQIFDLHQQAGKTMNCAICLEDVTCKNCLIMPVCSHPYHYRCFFNQVQVQCPVCRPNYE